MLAWFGRRVWLMLLEEALTPGEVLKLVIEKNIYQVTDVWIIEGQRGVFEYFFCASRRDSL
jgi:hypothetical protein